MFGNSGIYEDYDFRYIQELYYPNFVFIDDALNKDKICVSKIVKEINDILYDISRNQIESSEDDEPNFTFQEMIDGFIKIKEEWLKENPEWTDFYIHACEDLTLCARRLETDEEYEKRMSVIQENIKRSERIRAKEKEKRKELYLKLKEEFEK